MSRTYGRLSPLPLEAKHNIIVDESLGEAFKGIMLEGNMFGDRFETLLPRHYSAKYSPLQIEHRMFTFHHEKFP